MAATMYPIHDFFWRPSFFCGLFPPKLHYSTSWLGSWGTLQLGMSIFLVYKTVCLALAGLPGWLQHCPVHQKVVALIPIQCTFLGCRFDPLIGVHIGGSQVMFLSHINASISLSLSPSFPLSPTSINIFLGEDQKNKTDFQPRWRHR